MIKEFIETVVQDKDLYFLVEFSLILTAIIVSYILKAFLDKKVLVNFDELRGDSGPANFKIKFVRNFKYLSYPLYLTASLTLCYIFSIVWKLNVSSILLATQFGILWFSLRFITVLSGSKSPKLIVIIIATILLLNVFDLTEVTVASLEKLAIDFGSFKLSAFLIVKAIITVIVSIWVIGTISKIAERLVDNFRGLNRSAKNITTVIIDVLLYFTLFLVILRLIGIDITAVAVIGSAVGIGIGFGLQKITSNFISGLILLFERSIKEGDVIELSNSPEDMGFVKHLGIRYTLIRTFDDKEIMVPNEDFITNKVTNWTFSDKDVRIRIDIGVSYESDLDLVYKLIIEAANELHEEEVSHKPICFLKGYGDSSVDFILYVWVSDVNKVQHEKRSDVLFRVWQKFKENNITIPFPQRDLHFKSDFPKKVQNNPLKPKTKLKARKK